MKTAKRGNFLREVKSELKKVTWPTRQETLKYTIMVVFISVIVALFLGGLDIVFMKLIQDFVI